MNLPLEDHKEWGGGDYPNRWWPDLSDPHTDQYMASTPTSPGHMLPDLLREIVRSPRVAEAKGHESRLPQRGGESGSG